jgi:hypothetical protein
VFFIGRLYRGFVDLPNIAAEFLLAALRFAALVINLIVNGVEIVLTPVYNLAQTIMFIVVAVR